AKATAEAPACAPRRARISTRQTCCEHSPGLRNIGLHAMLLLCDQSIEIDDLRIVLLRIALFFCPRRNRRSDGDGLHHGLHGVSTDFPAHFRPSARREA